MRTAIIAAVLTLLPFPALAQSWMYAASLSDGSAVSIDLDSVRRTIKNPDRVSFRIQIESFGAVATASMSGNCQTGSWRVSSGRSNGATVTISDSTGDQLLNSACGMPYQVR